MTAPLPVLRSTLPLWRRAAQPRPLPTAWPALGWLLLFAVSVALFEEGGCSAADPCTAAPGLDLLEGLTVVGPFVLWLLPWHARPVTLVIVTGWVLTLLLAPQGLPVAEMLAATGVLAGWSLVVDRVLRAREQDARELAAAAPQALWPGPAPDPLAHPAWYDGLRLVGVLLVLAAGLFAFDLHRLGVAQEQEARAPRADAVVEAHGDDGYLITLRVGERTVEVDTSLAADYPVGSVQPVLLVGDEVRLVAEPLWPFAGMALGEALVAAACVLGARGRRRVVRVRDALTLPQPVFAVQAAPYDGGAVLLARDAGVLEGPALAVADVLLWSEDDEPDEDEPAEGVAQQAATAYGLPLPGHAVGVVTAGGEQLVPVGLAGGAPDLAALPFRDVLLEQEAEVGEPDPAGAAALRSEPWSLLLGRALALAGLPAVAVAVATADGPGQGVLRTLLVLNLAVGGLLRAAGRVDVEDDVLVVHGPLRRRRLPWSSLRAADAVGEDLVVLTRDGEAVPLPVPAPAVVVLRRQARRARTTAALSVLRHRIAAAPPADVEHEDARSLLAPAYALAVVVALTVGLVLR